MIYSFEPFGYEGSIISIEIDLRKGIPAIDIVGLADGAIKESRERVRSAILNQGFEFPSERILISLSPADLKKNSAGHDLALAMAILGASNQVISKEQRIMCLGELSLHGEIRPVRAVTAAINSAINYGITYFVIPKENESEIPNNVNYIVAENLQQAVDAVNNAEWKLNLGFSTTNKIDDVEFPEIENPTQYEYKGLKDASFAVALACAGKHHTLFVGSPGCGKSLLLNNLPQVLTPKATADEQKSIDRIYSIAGLSLITTKNKFPPFRQPHQTATIEGMCGGGVNCRPGEISLAHNGILFLDEAAEFRSSVLQMLRVPLETGKIVLSRAGRTTTYPAHFQLMMTSNPCPCGNYGSSKKICLCSARSIDLYWKKFSSPLLDRITIRFYVDRKDGDISYYPIKSLREMVSNAIKIQRNRGIYNNDLTVEQLSTISFSEDVKKAIEDFVIKHDASERSRQNIMRLCVTHANMMNRENVIFDDFQSIIKYHMIQSDLTGAFVE